MSASRDEGSISGTSLDVAEQNRSSPSATGPQGTNGSPGMGKGDGGKTSGAVNKSRPKSKDHTTTTFMRTHSAPPDEHAGIFEIGSNGVRSNQLQSFSGQPVSMIDPGSNSELQTSSNLSQPYPSTEQQATVVATPPISQSSKHQSPQHLSQKVQSVPPVISQHGSLGGISSSHQHQQHGRHSSQQKSSQRGGDNRGQYVDGASSYDHTNRGGVGVGMQGQQRMIPTTMKMAPQGQQQQQQQQPHPTPQYSQQQALQFQQPVYSAQQHQHVIGMNQMQHQQQGAVQPQLNFQGQAYLYYHPTPGNVQPFSVSNQQQVLQQTAVRSNASGVVMSQQGDGGNGSRVANNGSAGSGKSQSTGSSSGTSPQANPQGGTTQIPPASLSRSPHMIPQGHQSSSVGLSTLSSLPPSQGIVPQQQSTGGLLSYANGVNLVGYQMSAAQQQQQIRGGPIYTAPRGQLNMNYNAIGTMHAPQQQLQPMHMITPQQQIQQPSQPGNIPPVKEKKKLVLKDKNGNVIDMEQYAKKSQSSVASETSINSKVGDDVRPNTEKPVEKALSSEDKASMESTVPEKSVQTGEKNTEKIASSLSLPLDRKNNSDSTGNSLGDKNNTNSNASSEQSSVTPSSTKSPAVVSRGGYEIYDPIEDKKNANGSQSLIDDTIGTEEPVIPEPISLPTSVESTIIEKNIVNDTSARNDTKDDDDRNRQRAAVNSAGGSDSSIKEVPNTINIPKPTMSPGGILDKRRKKNNLKEKLAQADATSKTDRSGILDAYVTSSQRQDDKSKTKQDTETVREESSSVSTKTEVKESPDVEQDEEDSWEVQAMKIEQAEVAAAQKEKEMEDKEKTPPAPAKRSLRPGGGLEKKSGWGGGSKQNVIRYVFKKAELLKLKPAQERLERPRECSIYNNIVVIAPMGGGVSGGRGQSGNWKSGSSNAMQQQMAHQNQMSQGGHASSGDAGWQRGQQQPQSQHGGGGGGGGGGRRNRGPVPAMVKKVITDPLEVLTREVTDILNKIAPQTFAKLTTTLSEIQVHDSQMLETLVRLIFDKAITEPAYAMLYADMCQTLDSCNSYANFFNVVFNRDTNQYFWIKDMQYTNELAGPYKTHEECTNAILSVVPPPLNAVNHAVALDKIIVVNGILVSIIKSVEREDYFVSFVPLADVDEGLKSPQLFATHEAAHKSGLKKHSFQKILVTICQDEYQQSTSNQGYYAEPEIRRAALLEKRGTMDPEEYEVEMEELSMFEMAVKKRMMGNIRFIGELCKRKMIRTNTMHHCIRNLLLVEDGQKVDGGNVELVCKLLTSIGQKLEQDSSTSEEMEVVNSYFARLAELRNNKQIFSRIRFSIDEVIELRRNKWVARVEQDGPATLEEIRKRAAEDEERKAAAQQQLHSGHHGGYGNRGTTRGGARGGDSRGDSRGDVRNSSRQTTVIRNNRGGDVKGNDRRSSGGGGGGDSRGGSSRGKVSDHRQSEKQPPSPSTQAKQETTMSPDLLKKRTCTIVNEFVSSSNEQEALECLSELPSVAAGYLVANVLDKYLNTIKPSERESVLKLCAVLMSQLRAASSHVEKAIKEYENLVCLTDFTMDVKQAPELTGEVLRVLIEGRACRRETLDDLLAHLRNVNKNDEYGVEDHVIQDAHNRLRSKLQ